jgi:regulator of PEP synthase PpsR (kinase-PPPase family)
MKGYNMKQGTVGSKYQEVKNLSVKEIAKLVRKDLKQFNDCKFSVKSDRNSITITLMDSLLDKLASNEDYKETGVRFVVFEENFGNKLKEILNQYNYNNSDIMTDYSDVKFYSYIYRDGQLEDKYRNKYFYNKAA